MKGKPHILNPDERKKVREAWSEHPLFEVSEEVFYDRQVRLEGAEITSEDIFYATATLLDELWSNDHLTQRDIDRLWKMIYQVIREYKADATEPDRRQVAHTVFAITAKALCHHWRTLYCDTYFDMLRNTMDMEMQKANSEERERFEKLLVEESNSLSEWVNNVYDGRLSEAIDVCIGALEDSIPNDIFHDNLDENKIIAALTKFKRGKCGPKQFASVAKSFFEEIGWLKNRKGTDFVAWMKGHEIVSMRAKALTHVESIDAEKELKTRLRDVFQMLNGRKRWEDRNEFYKFNRSKINKG